MRKNLRTQTTTKTNNHTVSIITAILMFLFVIEMLLSSLSAHADTYSGTYNGDDYGQWAIYLDEKGINKAVAITWSEKTNIGSTGVVLTQTSSYLTLKFSNKSIISVTIDNLGNVKGLWENGTAEGTVSGNEIRADEVDQYETRKNIITETGHWIDLRIGYGLITGSGFFGNGSGIITPEDDVFYTVGDTVLWGKTYMGKTYNMVTGVKGMYYIPTADSIGIINQTNAAVANAQNAEAAKAGCFIGGIL